MKKSPTSHMVRACKMPKGRIFGSRRAIARNRELEGQISQTEKRWKNEDYDLFTPYSTVYTPSLVRLREMVYRKKWPRSLMNVTNTASLC